MCAEAVKEVSYLLLKKNDEPDDTDRDKLVHNAAQQAHLQHLTYDEPHDDKYHDTDEDIQRTRLFHQPVKIVEHQCHQHDVYHVFYSKWEKHNIKLTLSPVLVVSSRRRKARCGVWCGTSVYLIG